MSAEVKSAEGTTELCQLKIAQKTVLKTKRLYRLQFLTNERRCMASPIHVSYFATLFYLFYMKNVFGRNLEFQATVIRSIALGQECLICH